LGDTHPVGDLLLGQTTAPVDLGEEEPVEGRRSSDQMLPPSRSAFVAHRHEASPDDAAGHHDMNVAIGLFGGNRGSARSAEALESSQIGGCRAWQDYLNRAEHTKVNVHLHVPDDGDAEVQERIAAQACRIPCILLDSQTAGNDPSALEDQIGCTDPERLVVQTAPLRSGRQVPQHRLEVPHDASRVDDGETSIQVVERDSPLAVGRLYQGRCRFPVGVREQHLASRPMSIHRRDPSAATDHSKELAAARRQATGEPPLIRITGRAPRECSPASSRVVTEKNAPELGECVCLGRRLPSSRSTFRWS
jgi:hypothetical protein